MFKQGISCVLTAPAFSTPSQCRYVGADLTALVNEAALSAVSRAFRHVSHPVGSTAMSPGVWTAPAAPDITSCPVAAISPPPMTPNTTSLLETSLLADRSASAARPSLAERGTALDRMRDHRATFTPEQLAHVNITMADFEGALPRVQPAAKREGFATIPEVTWDDVGALATPRRYVRWQRSRTGIA